MRDVGVITALLGHLKLANPRERSLPPAPLPRGRAEERAARTAAGFGHSLPCTPCVAAAVTPTAICDAAPTICSQTRAQACL